MRQYSVRTPMSREYAAHLGICYDCLSTTLAACDNCRAAADVRRKAKRAARRERNLAEKHRNGRG